MRWWRRRGLPASRLVAAEFSIMDPQRQKQHSKDLQPLRVQQLTRAWEENQKSKADNRAEHKTSILSWENTKKSAVEAKLRTREEKLEKKQLEYAEKMRNRVAMIHKEAEEQRAAVEARRQEEMIKYQEMAAKHRSKGTTPKKKFLSCFG